MGKKVKTAKDLTGKQKAAVLLMSLDVDVASKVFKELEMNEVEQIAVEITNLKDIPSTIVEDVIEEFYQLITQKMVKFKTNPFLVAKLYGLIFRRFIASQMKPAEVEEAEVIFEAGKEKVSQKLVLKIIEPGFNLIFPLIKACKLEKEVKVEERKFYLVPKEKPFSQGSLIEEMKRKGLGRPSTYALIIDHLLQRRYLKEFKNQLFPTRLGILVFNYLQKNFGEYVSEDLTRKLEEKMDKVEEGKEDYQKILKEFYQIKNLLS